MDPKNKTAQPAAPHPKVVEDKLTKTRNNLGLAFKEFAKIIKDKILDTNKTAAQKNTEKQVVDDLYKTAVSLEQQNMTEGVFAVAMIALRTHLMTRDRVNELEYELYLTKKEIKLLKQKMGIKDDETKGKS